MSLCANMFFLFLLYSVIWVSAQQEGHDMLLHSVFHRWLQLFRCTGELLSKWRYTIFRTLPLLYEVHMGLLLLI